MSDPSHPSPDRGTWGNHIEFLLTSLGLAVGVGNVWRFPYVAYSNGGGTFLVPYVLSLVLLGLPLLFQEMAIGQYAKVGSNKLFAHMVPIFKGLGYALFVKVFIGMNYYMVIISWCVYYLFAGFATVLPWDTCTEDWNTRNCYADEYNSDCEENEIFYNFECSPKSKYCQEHGFVGWNAEEDSCVVSDNEVSIYEVLGVFSVSPAEDYFNGKVLGLTKNSDGEQYNWDDFGHMRWELVLCQLFGWLIIALIILKGTRSLGKAAYVLTTLPYLILTILLGYSLTLPGAGDGIDFYMSPDWSLLTDSTIWFEAAVQVIMSTAIALGSHMVLASYNNRDGRILLDSIIIILLNSLTSVYAGFAVFAMTGFLAQETGADVDNVVQGGIILAFVTYPAAFLSMDVPPLWSFLFFFMLLNLSLSSVAAGVQMMVSFVTDEYPDLEHHRLKVLACVSVLCAACGLPYTYNAGIHLFTLMDSRGVPNILSLCILQCVAVSWFYGIRNFLSDLKEMKLWLPRWAEWAWGILLVVVVPGLLIYFYLYSVIDLDPVSYGLYEYPDYVQALGMVLLLLPLIIFGVYALWFVGKALLYNKMSLQELAAFALKPTGNWRRLRDEKFAVQEDDMGHHHHHEEGERKNSVKLPSHLGESTS